MLLNSAALIGLIIYIRLSTITPEMALYYVAPYFGIIAYYITTLLRFLGYIRSPVTIIEKKNCWGVKEADVMLNLRKRRNTNGKE
jgi:hypothetical protein